MTYVHKNCPEVDDPHEDPHEAEVRVRVTSTKEMEYVGWNATEPHTGGFEFDYHQEVVARCEACFMELSEEDIEEVKDGH